MDAAPEAVKRAPAGGLVVNRWIHPGRFPVQARAGCWWLRSPRRWGGGRPNQNEGKTIMNHKKILLSTLLSPILVGAAFAPAAFAQVLGGAVNVGGGIGAQAGPVGIGGNVGADASVRTDAIRETTRRARDVATRVEAEAQAAANAGVQTAGSATAHAAGQANAAADAGLATAQDATAAQSVAGNVRADADAATGAQAATHADDHAGAAVAGNAAATAQSAVTTPAVSQDDADAKAGQKAESRAEQRARKRAGRLDRS